MLKKAQMIRLTHNLQRMQLAYAVRTKSNKKERLTILDKAIARVYSI